MKIQQKIKANALESMRNMSVKNGHIFSDKLNRKYSIAVRRLFRELKGQELKDA